MKESGINYFFEKIALNTGNFMVFYTFEDNAGTSIASVPSGQSLFGGTLSSLGEFWNVPNSGFVSGNHIKINNASGLDSEFWTQMFVYDKLKGNDCALLTSLNGSGYKIGINDANKIYFETSGGLVYSSLNNISSKNAVALSYSANILNIHYYDFTRKAVETESFNADFGMKRSDHWLLFSGFTGYADYYLYFNTLYSSEVIGQIFSGLQYRKTGSTPSVETICYNTITGYQNVAIIETGVTGYASIPNGGAGQGYYTGEFAQSSTTTPLTGIISQNFISSGVTGLACYDVTGGYVDLFEQLSGYAQSFGMEKFMMIFPTESQDILKYGLSNVPSVDNYNRKIVMFNSVYFFEGQFDSGNLNSFLNGLALHTSGVDFSNTRYWVVSGSDDFDVFLFDVLSGSKNTLDSTGGALAYSGQQIFFNGINLISGKDFVTNGNYLIITGENTGINGRVFEYPSLISFATGNFTVYSGQKFSRYGSVLYFNGLRQNIGHDYVEGCLIDKLRKNDYNYLNSKSVYDNNGLFWE